MKIVICNNRIDEYRDSRIEISSNRIIFRENGDYTLEYINSNDIS